MANRNTRKRNKRGEGRGRERDIRVVIKRGGELETEVVRRPNEVGKKFTYLYVQIIKA